MVVYLLASLAGSVALSSAFFSPAGILGTGTSVAVLALPCDLSAAVSGTVAGATVAGGRRGCGWRWRLRDRGRGAAFSRRDFIGREGRQRRQSKGGDERDAA